MKRFIVSTLSIFMISLFCLSCKLVTVDDQDLADAPEVCATESGISVTVYKLNNSSKYINIYRRDVTSSTPEEAAIVNIGLIYPKTYDEGKRSFLIQDKLVIKTYKYQYMVRYATEDGKYYNSEWSDTIQATNGNAESTLLKYGIGSTKFHFTETDYTLKIAGTISNPAISNFDKEWVPMLAVKSETKTMVFKLENVNNNTTINLRGLLSSDFLNTEIQILGIIGQKEIKTTPEDNSTPEIQQIFWTELSTISVSGRSENKITVKSDAESDGYDFS